MNQIRQIYLAQKKKEIRNHFMLVGVAAALLGALAAAVNYLEQLRTGI